MLIVKENQPTLLADSVQVFAPLTSEELARTGVHTVQPLPITTYRTVEKGHGRLEQREIGVSSELADYSAWPYLVQVFEYTRRWTAKGVTKQQVRHGITSLPPTVARPSRWRPSSAGIGKSKMVCITSKMSAWAKMLARRMSGVARM